MQHPVTNTGLQLEVNRVLTGCSLTKVFFEAQVFTRSVLTNIFFNKHSKSQGNKEQTLRDSSSNLAITDLLLLHQINT